MGSPIYIQLKGDVKLTPEVLRPYVTYQCDGVNKRFIFPYDFVQIEDIRLTVVDLDGTEEVQTHNIAYDEMDKAIIYPNDGDALANGKKVILERVTPISQDTDLPDEYPFENIEHSTDKIIMILQEMKAELNRSLKVRPHSDENPDELVKLIVERSVKAAEDAIKAVATIEAKTDKVATDLDTISQLNAEIKALAERAETAADKAEQVSYPNAKGLVTKADADAKYQTKDSLTGIVSVKDFGAVGDGVADDTAAFKKANNNLENKILFVPTGIYKLNEHITFNTVGSVMDMGTYSNIKPFYPTETPMLKGANNIAFVKNIQYGEEVNQCQGFTYNDKKNVFVLACINSDGTTQILYELNADTLEIVGTYKYNDSEKMGHCNTMCYNKNTNKIYLANGLKNGNNLTVLDADTMQYERTITLNERVFNIAYDHITRTYASIVPISGNKRVRQINLYNDDFVKMKSYQVDYQYDDFNNNGAFMLNGCIMSATLGSLVECTPFGTVKQIIEINPKTEIEDIAYYNGKFYFAVLTMQPNKKHKVDIYVGDPSREYENSINTQKLTSLDYLKLTGGNVTGAIKMANNTLIEGFKTDGHGVGMVKVSTNDGIEFGDASVNVFIKGKEFKYYDGTDSFTVLTTKHYGTAIYNKKQIDDAFVKKGDVGAVSNGANKQMTITHPLFGDGATECGDCTFIGVDGKWFIIDSLQKTDANLNSILKCMTDNGIEKFEFGFVSHYHSDHIGNFAELIKRGKIAKMYLPNPDKTEVIGRYGMTAQVLNTIANGIKAECTAKSVPVETIEPKTIDFNGASITFYNCSDDDYNYYRSINNDDYNNVSACLEINYLNRTAIFEGDSNYNAMERNAMRNPANVDYLKSNHHAISQVPISYRKLNPRDVMITATQSFARENLYVQNYQATFLQMGCNLYLLGDQIVSPKITYYGNGHIEYNRELLRDGTAGQATSLEIYVDRNYTGTLKTGDVHSPFTHLADAVRFINNAKHSIVTVKISAGEYTRPDDMGDIGKNHTELRLRNIHNKVIFMTNGSGTANLPPMVIEFCNNIHFKNVSFLGTSASDNRKIQIYDTTCTFENCKLDSVKQATNKDGNNVVIQSQDDSMLKLINVNFTGGWAALQVAGGMVLLTGTENHCNTSHAYVLQSGVVMVETPFTEKNNVNKFDDSAAKEAGQIYFKAVKNTAGMPNNLMTGTIVPAKNRDFPQITQFVQMKSTKLADFVYSLTNITETTTPVFTGQIGYNGEEVYFGINGKWVKISN